MLCTVVVSRNGLHSHSDTHYNHDKEHLDTVEDAECTDGHITSIIEQTVINENHDVAGTHIHDEGRHADGKNIGYDVLFQPHAVTLEADISLRAVEVIQYPQHADEL